MIERFRTADIARKVANIYPERYERDGLTFHVDTTKNKGVVYAGKCCAGVIATESFHEEEWIEAELWLSPLPDPQDRIYKVNFTSIHEAMDWCAAQYTKWKDDMGIPN